MNVYLSIIKAAFKNSMAYKIKLIFYSMSGIVQFFIYYSLWKSIYLNQGYYKGFNQTSILTYFVLSFVIQSLLPRWVSMEIGWSVKKGDIVHNFLKPIHFKKYYFYYSFGDVFFTYLFMGIPVIILSLFTSSIVPCQNVLGFLLSTAMAYMIVFHLFYIIGLLSFWFTNIWGIFITFDFIYLFFSGAYLPFEFMPKWLQTISGFLPFQYIVSFPISVWLNNFFDFKGFLTQCIWLILLVIISEVVYKKAIKKLEIFGG